MLAQGWDRKVVDFWFMELTEEQWWTSPPPLDEMIRSRFLDTHRIVASAAIDALITTPTTALAAVIALDQFPRNMFRRTAAAFATDAKALAVAAQAIDRGHDVLLATEQRSFLYMPFMHAEDGPAQHRSLQLSATLGDDTRRAAKDHADLIARFGRFPHRNAVLGRTDTAEEAAYLAGEAKRFGQ